MAVATLELRVGDIWVSRSRGVREGVRPRGVQGLVSEVGVVVVFWSLEGEVSGVGVVGRMVGEGDEGDSGRRKGEVRGEPKERGEGLYVDGRD